LVRRDRLASRRVLSWSLYNTLTTDFYLDALQEAITSLQHAGHLQHGPRLPVHQPGIHVLAEGVWYPDQHGWTRLLARQPVRGRLWKSVKYEEVYLQVYEHQRWVDIRQILYQRRSHNALDDKTPDEVYFDKLPASPQTA
jgi:putative transposase